MNCEYVRQHYQVLAEIGRRIKHRGSPGVIAADRGHYIGVNFDEDKPNIIYNVHPTDDVEYLEMGTVRKMTPSQKRYQDYLEVADCFESFKAYLDYLSSQPKKLLVAIGASDEF